MWFVCSDYLKVLRDLENFETIRKADLGAMEM